MRAKRNIIFYNEVLNLDNILDVPACKSTLEESWNPCVPTSGAMALFDEGIDLELALQLPVPANSTLSMLDGISIILDSEVLCMKDFFSCTPTLRSSDNPCVPTAGALEAFNAGLDLGQALLLFAPATYSSPDAMVIYTDNGVCGALLTCPLVEEIGC